MSAPKPPAHRMPECGDHCVMRRGDFTDHLIVIAVDKDSLVFEVIEFCHVKKDDPHLQIRRGSYQVPDGRIQLIVWKQALSAEETVKLAKGLLWRDDVQAEPWVVAQYCKTGRWPQEQTQQDDKSYLWPLELAISCVVVYCFLLAMNFIWTRAEMFHLMMICSIGRGCELILSLIVSPDQGLGGKILTCFGIQIFGAKLILYLFATDYIFLIGLTCLIAFRFATSLSGRLPWTYSIPAELYEVLGAMIMHFGYFIHTDPQPGSTNAVSPIACLFVVLWILTRLLVGFVMHKVK